MIIGRVWDSDEQAWLGSGDLRGRDVLHHQAGILSQAGQAPETGDDESQIGRERGADPRKHDHARVHISRS